MTVIGMFLPKGAPFAGAPNSVLEFEGFRIKEVRNIKYELFA